MLTIAMTLIHTIFRSGPVTGLAATLWDISLVTPTSLNGHSCADETWTMPSALGVVLHLRDLPFFSVETHDASTGTPPQSY